MKNASGTGKRPVESGGELRRELGALDGAALVVGTVVGVGIFTVPGIVYGMVPDPRLFLAVWVSGGLLSLAGALSYAELATRYPRAGGEYVYLREAFGPTAGFLSGWASLVAGFSGAVAAAAVAFAEYLDRIWPGAGSGGPLLDLSLPVLSSATSPRSMVALGIIALMTGAHLAGLRAGRAVQNLLAVGTVALLAGLVGFGLAFGGGPAPVAAVAHGGAAGIVGEGVDRSAGAPGWGILFLATIPILFTYSGWNAAAYVAGEFRNPARDLRRALVGGTLIVTALYVGANLLFLRVLSPEELAGNVAVGEAVARGLLGPAGGTWIAVTILVVLAASVGSMTATGPRIYFAMARDRCLPALLGRVSRRTKIPVAAILLQGVWSGVLVLSGTFEALITYTGFAVILFSAWAVAGLFPLRRKERRKAHREGGEPRASGTIARVPGDPWVSGTFVAVGAAVVAMAILSGPGPALAGLAIVAAGLPLRWALKRPKR